jgi:hypothetical protein
VTFDITIPSGTYNYDFSDYYNGVLIETTSPISLALQSETLHQILTFAALPGGTYKIEIMINGAIIGSSSVVAPIYSTPTPTPSPTVTPPPVPIYFCWMAMLTNYMVNGPVSGQTCIPAVGYIYSCTLLRAIHRKLGLQLHRDRFVHGLFALTTELALLRLLCVLR